jgi:hypothetical protein
VRRLALGLSVGCALLGFASTTSAAVSENTTFDYLYIESNEGGSSGGHTAIRFGPQIYHFQNRDGLLVLDRERSGDFLFAYALLNNRTVHVSSIGVDPEIEARLASRFLDRYQAQAAQIAVYDALQQDLELLESAGSPILSVPGYGYFREERSPNPAASTALRSLREKVIADKGVDFLKARRLTIQKALAALEREDPAAWPVALPESADDHPVFAQPWSTRVGDLAAGLAALDVLDQTRPLDPAAVNAPAGEAFRLRADERRAIERFAHRLETQLLGLVDSRREDWGQTLLIGMARLAALEASLASDRFVFLDSFPEDHGAIDVDTLRRRTDIVPMMLEETRTQLAAARRYFARSPTPDELAWERVEERLVRHRELLRAAAGEQELRLARGHLLPKRPAPYHLPTLAATADLRSGSVPSAALVRVRDRERAYRARLRRLHHYGLVYRNCVTEIFGTVNAEFAESPKTTQQSALGGVVGGADSLGFIPFVSALQVDARYRVLARYTLPSYRGTRLREMRKELSPFWLALRESNTFTAKAYRRGDQDSFFVFFSEDPIWLRPVFGAVNFAAALGESVWGLFKLPFDRGQTLISGLEGAFMSLPELAFANIRKGSNDWVEPEFRNLDLRSVPRSDATSTRSRPSRRWSAPPKKVGALARRSKSADSP